MLDLAKLAHILGLQRPGEAEALYKVALQAPRGKQIVELGTFHGYTAGVLAMAAREIGATVVTVDDYQDRTKQRVPAHIGAAKVRVNLELAGLGDLVTVIESDSRNIPPDVTNVGMVWIDSTHTAEQLTAELDRWLRLIPVGGIIAFHDYGGANTPQLKPVIDKTFANRRHWQIAVAFYTIIGFKRIA